MSILSWLRFPRDRKAPAVQAASIAPADADLATPVRSLYVGGAGDVQVTALEDTSAVIFKAVPAGTILPVSCKRVWLTNTTATQILGLS